MKRLISLLTASVMTISIYAISVFAHGHNAKNVTGNASVSSQKTTASTSVRYYTCSVEDCLKTGLHTHGSKNYTAHYYGDGHDYHDYCGVEDCTVLGYHEHDGEYCFGHNINDGHDYHDYCDIANCTINGYHEHNGDYCFSYNGYSRSGSGCHNR